MRLPRQHHESIPRRRSAARGPIAWGLILLGAAIVVWLLATRQSPARSAKPAIPAGAPREQARLRRGEYPVIGPTRHADRDPIAERAQVLAALRQRLEQEKQFNATRRQAALDLARDGSPAAMAVLKQAALGGDVELAEIIAGVLGNCRNAESLDILKTLLAHTNEPVVLASVQSLGQHGTAAALSLLRDVLQDAKQTIDVRAEAALSAGATPLPEAFTMLRDALGHVADEAIASQIVRAIASRPFEESGSFLQTYLNTREVASDLKAEALKALGGVKGDTAGLLLNFAQNEDAELRAAAVRGLGGDNAPSDVGDEIVALLATETDSLVRKRLYQALAHQQSFDLAAAWAQTESERDPAVRMAGLRLLADAVQQSRSADIGELFDSRAVPELKAMALNSESMDNRLAAVMALRRAGTDISVAALQQVATQTADPRVTEALEGFAKRRRR